MLENTGQKNTDNTQTKHNPEKANNAKHSKAKLRTSQETNNDLELLQVLLAFLRSAVTVKTDT